MADVDKMDPDVRALFKSFFEAGMNIGLGHPAMPQDVDKMFSRFVLLNDPKLEEVRMYRA